jgi:hypothetical protein
MNATRTLTFLWTPTSLVISIAVVLITAGLCFLAWRRSGYRRSLGVLELLRLVIVILAAVLFNQPEWVEEYQEEEKPSIAVLWDNSGSMATRDVVGDADGLVDSTPVTRAEAIDSLKADATWDGLRARMDVVVEPFSRTGEEEGTNLFAPLADSLERFPNLLGVVLVSDGDWNEGQPPVEAANRLRVKGVPVFGVPVGSRDRLPDVEVLSLDAPTFGVVGKAVRIPFTIESSLPHDYTTTVTLKTSEGERISKDVRVAAMGRASDALTWHPKTVGDFTVTLDVPEHRDETRGDNNSLAAPVSIRDEKLKVLVIESYPRWEYRYLRNALSRDPGVEVSCLLFHPGLSKVGGGNKDYIKAFPAGKNELSVYDVVVLGDVGLDDGQLSVEECRMLRGLVESQASGLILMPGWEGRQLSLLDTELDDLYPAVLDVSQPGGWGTRVAGHFELTEAGRRSLLTKLADTDDDNATAWENLPGFQWHAPVLRAKAGTEVLAVHKDISNEFGRLPLLITRTFGAGKVLFMGTDGAWRWRRGVEDKYHYRFWGQVVRWMAYQRNMAEGESMRLYFSPDQPRMRQTLALNANVMEGSGEPLMNGDVTARIVAPSGKAETVRFTAAGDEWGLFHGRYTTREAGQHSVLLACRQTGATLETSFFVQGVPAERIGRPARPEVLEEIARVTRGKVIAADAPEEIVDSLATLPEPPPSIRRVQLWSHPVVAGVFVFLLGVFWVCRKVLGLI